MRNVREYPRKVREIETAWIEMSDGCRLAARIWLPEGAEEVPVPAVLEHLPYRRRDFTRLRGDAEHAYIAASMVCQTPRSFRKRTGYRRRAGGRSRLAFSRLRSYPAQFQDCLLAIRHCR